MKRPTKRRVKQLKTQLKTWRAFPLLLAGGVSLLGGGTAMADDGGCQGVALHPFTPPSGSAESPLTEGQIIPDLSEGTGDREGAPLTYVVPEGQSYPANAFRLLNCRVVRHFKSSESDPGYTLETTDALTGMMAEPRPPQTPPATPSTSTLSGVWKGTAGLGAVQLPELVFTSGTNVVEIDGVFNSRRKVNASIQLNLDSGLFVCNRQVPIVLQFGNGATFTSKHTTCFQNRLAAVGFEPTEKIGAAVETSLPVSITQEHTVLRIQANGIAHDINAFRWQIDPAKNKPYFDRMLLPGKY